LPADPGDPARDSRAAGPDCSARPNTAEAAAGVPRRAGLGSPGTPGVGCRVAVHRRRSPGAVVRKNLVRFAHPVVSSRLHSLEWRSGAPKTQAEEGGHLTDADDRGGPPSGSGWAGARRGRTDVPGDDPAVPGCGPQKLGTMLQSHTPFPEMAENIRTEELRTTTPFLHPFGFALQISSGASPETMSSKHPVLYGERP